MYSCMVSGYQLLPPPPPPPPDTYMYTAAVCGRNTLQLRVLINENYRRHEHLVVRQAVDPAQ